VIGTFINFEQSPRRQGTCIMHSKMSPPFSTPSFESSMQYKWFSCTRQHTNSSVLYSQLVICEKKPILITIVVDVVVGAFSLTSEHAVAPCSYSGLSVCCSKRAQERTKIVRLLRGHSWHHHRHRCFLAYVGACGCSLLIQWVERLLLVTCARAHQDHMTFARSFLAPSSKRRRRGGQCCCQYCQCRGCRWFGECGGVGCVPSC
jgi:hypothetical protein